MAKKMETEKSKPNLSPDTVVEFAGRLGTTLRKIREAQSEHANEVKRAKAAGIETRELLAVLKLRRQDPEEAAASERTKRRYAAFLGMPLGTQVELFEPGDEQHPSDKAQHEYALSRAYDDGHFAGAEGHTRESNAHPQASEPWQRWDKGWLDGQATIAADMASGKPARGRKGKGNPLESMQAAGAA